MKSYNIEVKSISEFKIDIDENVWDEQRRKEFGKVFWKINDIEYMAETLAQNIKIVGIGKFIEGFGYLKTFYHDGEERTQWKGTRGGYEKVTEFCEGITVTILDYETIESEIIK